MSEPDSVASRPGSLHQHAVPASAPEDDATESALAAIQEALEKTYSGEMELSDAATQLFEQMRGDGGMAAKLRSFIWGGKRESFQQSCEEFLRATVAKVDSTARSIS